LANKAGKVAVLEVLGQYRFCEFLVLLTASPLVPSTTRQANIVGSYLKDNETVALIPPSND
jgi:hypothetical protein